MGEQNRMAARSVGRVIAMSSASRELLKVTSFILRPSARGGSAEVLLLDHPNAGIQVPAGTVEEGEAPEAAAVREAMEETGLDGFGPPRAAGVMVETLDEPASLMLRPAPVHLRPDARSASWAHLRRGIGVVIERREAGFVQVTYEEFDRVPDPQYVTARITGWVEAAALTQVRRRFFYILPFDAAADAAWTHHADHHDFRLFWAPVDAMPDLISPQDQWVRYLREGLARAS
jgi:8-oxo-dGTP pyrophosphatase MutT (NUDIX family)